MVRLAQVVRATVNDNGALRIVSHSPALRSKINGEKTYANDALGADQLDELVRHGALSVALGVGLEVAQVTDVALGVAGSSVGLVERVDCRAM